MLFILYLVPRKSLTHLGLYQKFPQGQIQLLLALAHRLVLKRVLLSLQQFEQKMAPKCFMSLTPRKKCQTMGTKKECMHTCDLISQIASKTTSQKIALFIPSMFLQPKLTFVKKQKNVKNALFVILKKLNMIDLQMNTTKVVIMTLPDYNHPK